MRFRGRNRPARITLMEEDPFRQIASTTARPVIPETPGVLSLWRVVAACAPFPPC